MNVKMNRGLGEGRLDNPMALVALYMFLGE